MSNPADRAEGHPEPRLAAEARPRRRIARHRRLGLQAARRPGSLDVDLFEELLAAAGARSSAATLKARPTCCARSLALWRGPPLADLAYEPFAQAEIARLEERRLVALEDRIEADLVLGRHATSSASSSRSWQSIRSASGYVAS